MIKYYIERNGMYYNSYVNFGTVCENASKEEYTYLKKHLIHISNIKNTLLKKPQTNINRNIQISHRNYIMPCIIIMY